MAMMAKMRSLAPAFIISVGALFVLFMVISDSSVLEALSGRSNNVGSINGKEISYQEFAKDVDQQRQNQKSQTGQDIPEENMDAFRDQVWDAVVTRALFDQQIKKFGITVSNQEIRDIILGPNPPEFLKRSFIDSTGKFNRQMYETAIFNPRNKEGLLQAEDIVRQTRLNEKLQSLLLASVTVSEQEIKRKFIEDNTKLNDQYVLVSLSDIPDSTIKITDEDLKDYYNKNIDKYKVEAQRKLKFVLFSTTPSGEDSATVKRNLENVAQNIAKDTASFKSNVEIYSSSPYSKDTVNLSALPEAAANLIYKASAGAVVGPVATNEGYVLYKISAILPSSETIVRASHILINQFGSDAKNLEEANKLYKEIKGGADFTAIASEKSADPGSAKKGGDLGWFGKGRMVPEFEKATFEGKLNEVQKPVKSNFGYHIIKVTGKSNKKYVIEKIVEPIKPSASTIDDKINAAKDFAYLANKNDFTKEAELVNYKIQETPPFIKEVYSIPKIGVSKRLIDFAFNNSQNSISDAIKTNQGYVVAKISEIINENVKPFDEVKNSIKPLVLKEKKYLKAKEIAKNIKSKVNNDLSKAASVYGKAIVNVTGSFDANGSIPGIGRDYAVIQESLNIELNKISNPVRGQRGYYLLKVLERTPFDKAAYSIQRTSIMSNLLQQKRSSFFNQWISELKKNAKIVDNRYQFYN